MPSFIEKKSQYVPVLGMDDDSLDGEPAFLLSDQSWKRRFYILLAATISLMIPLGAPVKLQYVNRVLKEDPDTPKFMGKPRPELDDAWHELLDSTLIRFSSEEMMFANNASSIAHKDGGFVGGLGVSHTLHCLIQKRIKQYLHPDYYYPGEQDWAELDWHVDHCLDSVRKEVLCKASADVYTLEWTIHSDERPSVTVPQAHMCVDWESLHSWMKERAAGYDDMDGCVEDKVYNSRILGKRVVICILLPKWTHNSNSLASLCVDSPLLRRQQWFIATSGALRRLMHRLGGFDEMVAVAVNVEPNCMTVDTYLAQIKCHIEVLPPLPVLPHRLPSASLATDRTRKTANRPEVVAPSHRCNDVKSVNYANPAGLIAGCVVLEVVAGVSVALRFITRRWKQQKVIHSDWLVLVAFIFGTGLTVLEIYGGTLEEAAVVSERLNSAKHVEFAFLILGVLGVGFVKLSTCFLYWNLFGKLMFRPFLIFWTIIIFFWTLAFSIFFFAECGDHLLALFAQPADYDRYCKASIPAGWVQVGTDVGTDLVTLLIPIPVVLRLQMSRNLKALTLLIFAIGGLSVGASTVKAYIYISATLNRFTEDAICVSIWNLAEVQIGIVATCGPVIRSTLAQLSPSSQSVLSLLNSFKWSSNPQSAPTSNYVEVTDSEDRLRRAGSNGPSEDDERIAQKTPQFELGIMNKNAV
ncbi:hypothetical protein CHU98_g8984 [Xylaria longipes]|nr:hypothetical protein CHU98_g8984 [Xylaria longipes]